MHKILSGSYPKYCCIRILYLLVLIPSICYGQSLDSGLYKIEFIKGDDVIRFDVNLQCEAISYSLSSADPMYDLNMQVFIQDAIFLGFDANYEGGCLLRGSLIDRKSIYGDGVWQQLSETPSFVKFSLKQQSKVQPSPPTPPNPSPKTAEFIQGEFTDPRDQQVYKTVTIGKRCWMAENLRFKTVGGCIENIDGNFQKDGYFYNWRAANVACPKGWHLPSSEEWESLINSLGAETAAQQLKAADAWPELEKNNSSTGFEVYPSGFFSPSIRGFTQVGDQALFWTSSDYFSQDAYYFELNTTTVKKRTKDKTHALNCRCLQD